MKEIDIDGRDALLRRLMVTESGIEIIRKIRSEQLLRPKPQLRQGRTCGWWLRSRTGCAVYCNDTVLQIPLLHELEDPLSNCCEYYSWPMDIGPVRYSVGGGARVEARVFRPFLLKISETWCGFLDVFPTSMLRNSVIRGSGLYEQTNPEQWVSIPIRNGYQAMVSAIRFSQRRIFRPGIGEHS